MKRLLLIPPRELPMYLGNENIVVVDLREKPEYDRSHIGKAINIPYEELEERYNQLKQYRMIILYCNHGNQSLLAARRMSDSGFLVGSIAGGYKAYKMATRR